MNFQQIVYFGGFNMYKNHFLDREFLRLAKDVEEDEDVEEDMFDHRFISAPTNLFVLSFIEQNAPLFTGLTPLSELSPPFRLNMVKNSA